MVGKGMCEWIRRVSHDLKAFIACIGKYMYMDAFDLAAVGSALGLAEKSRLKLDVLYPRLIERRSRGRYI